MKFSFLFVPILFSSMLGQWLEQTDWSGGPVGSGPVDWWNDEFLNSQSIDWNSNPGEITIQLSDFCTVRSGSAFPANSDDFCSGTLTSILASIPAGTDWNIEWGDIWWTCSEPDTTDIYIQLRTGNTPETMGPWGDPIYESGTYLGTLLPDNILLIQYRICLETNSYEVFPVFYDITIEGWYPGAVENEDLQIHPPKKLSFGSIPASGNVNGFFILTEPCEVQLTVYDTAGRSIHSILNETLDAGEHTFNQRISTPGVYCMVLETPGEIEAEMFTVLLP